MAEVFQGTPCIVTVVVWDQQGKKVEFNICGREMSTVKDAVRKALEGIPDEGQKQMTEKKTRKPRRTKAQMKASEVVAQTPDAMPEVAMAGAARGKAWAD